MRADKSIFTNIDDFKKQQQIKKDSEFTPNNKSTRISTTNSTNIYVDDEYIMGWSRYTLIKKKI